MWRFDYSFFSHHIDCFVCLNCYCVVQYRRCLVRRFQPDLATDSDDLTESNDTSNDGEPAPILTKNKRQTTSPSASARKSRKTNDKHAIDTSNNDSQLTTYVVYSCFRWLPLILIVFMTVLPRRRCPRACASHQTHDGWWWLPWTPFVCMMCRAAPWSVKKQHFSSFFSFLLSFKQNLYYISLISITFISINVYS